MKTALLSLLLFVFAAPASAQTAPVMQSLSTGSEVASWIIAADVPKHKVPIIFLHGGPGLYTEPRRLEEGAAFRAAGFNTIYYDQAGGGRSKRLPASQYTVARAIDDLEALRVKLGQDRVILWGNSWGATLATLYANRFPERVAGFILTSPGTFPSTNAKRDYSVTNRDKVVLGKDISRAGTAIAKKGAAAEATISQELAGLWFDAVVSAELIEAMVCKGSKITPPALSGGGNFFANRLMLKELEKRAFQPSKQPNRPTLIVRGACDYLTAENAAKYATHMGGTVLTIQGAGHGLLEQQTLVQKAFADFAAGALNDLD